MRGREIRDEQTGTGEARPRREVTRRRLVWLGALGASGLALTTLAACGGDGDDDGGDGGDDDDED